MPATISSLPSEGHKHQRVLATLRGLIESGTFAPGDRVSSVREMADQMGVSVTTVLQAYRALENEGVIEARPQSGFFVRARPCARLVKAPLEKPVLSKGPVRTEDLAMRLMRDTRDRSLVQLGAAIPNPSLVPTEKLTRLLGTMSRRHARLSTSYDPPPGCEALRVQVAQRALHAGCALAPDEIVVTVGAQEAINLALRATCKPGDIVAIESPSFFGTLQTIESLGLRTVEIPADPGRGINLDALRQALRKYPVAACIVVTNYSNPLGCAMSDEAKRDLVAILGERQIPLIEDDIYGDLCHGAKRPGVARSHDRDGGVLLCSSFSKTIAPGYRAGWIAPGRYRERIEHLKMTTNISGATPPLLAIAEFLANGGYDHHLRKCRRAYAENCARIAQTVNETFPPGTRASHPDGGFVLWVEMPAHVDSVALYGEAVQNGITFAPGTLFSPSRAYRNFLRLSCAAGSDEVRDAVAKLGRLASRFEPQVRDAGNPG